MLQASCLPTVLADMTNDDLSRISNRMLDWEDGQYNGIDTA